MTSGNVNYDNWLDICNLYETAYFIVNHTDTDLDGLDSEIDFITCFAIYGYGAIK